MGEERQTLLGFDSLFLHLTLPVSFLASRCCFPLLSSLPGSLSFLCASLLHLPVSCDPALLVQMWDCFEVGLCETCVPKTRPLVASFDTQPLSLSPKGAPGLSKPCPGHSCGRQLQRHGWEISFPGGLCHEHLGISQ